jgi:hypothetical protein
MSENTRRVLASQFAAPLVRAAQPVAVPLTQWALAARTR